MMKKDKQSGQRHRPEWVFRPERAAAAARREMQDFIERHQRAGDRNGKRKVKNEKRGNA